MKEQLLRSIKNVLNHTGFMDIRITLKLLLVVTAMNVISHNIFAQRSINRNSYKCEKCQEKVALKDYKTLAAEAAATAPSKGKVKSNEGMEAVTTSTAVTSTSASSGAADNIGVANLVPPSPNAAALGSFGDYKVNHYTGNPIVEIPLFELKGRQLSTAVSLGYKATGIKIDEIPSWVGSNWTLNAGGAITRVMKGRPDEEPSRGFFAKPVDVNNIQGVSAQRFLEASAGNWDTEADIFYFNFGGHSGKIVFDHNKNFTIIPHQDLQVTTNIVSGHITSLSIIDGNGVKYSFGTALNSVESTVSQTATYTSHFLYPSDPINPSSLLNSNQFIFDACGLIQEPTFGLRTHPTFNSTWYLSEIEDLSTSEKITFSYVDEGWIVFRTGISEEFIATKVTKRDISGSTFPFDFQFDCDQVDFVAADEPFGCLFNPNNGFTPKGRDVIIVSETMVTVRSKRLTSISTQTGASLVFTAAHVREDIEQTVDVNGNLGQAKALTKITLQDNSNRIKELHFNYSYMVSTDLNTLISRDPESIAVDSKRLFLNNIKEYVTATNQSKTAFEFQYNPGTLPIRNSPKQDYMGYYNMNANSFRFPKKWYDDLLYPIAMQFYPSIDYAATSIGPNVGRTRTGVLKTIVYPTGGSTTYYYELNQNSFGDLPGLRVSRIENNDGVGLTGVKTYSYTNENGTSSGYMVGNVNFSYQQDAQYTHNGTACAGSKIYSASNSFAELGTTQGNLVGYDRVVETIEGNGKNEYLFKSPRTISDADTDVLDFTGGGAVAANHPYPFPPKSSMDYKRGMLEFFNQYNLAGQKLRSVEYQYDIDGNYFAAAFKSAKVGHHMFNENAALAHFTYGVYTYPTSWIPLKSVIETSYDQLLPGDESKKIVTTTEYSYRPVHSVLDLMQVAADLQLRKTTQILPDGNKLVTENKYITDYAMPSVAATDPAALGIRGLKTSNIKNVVVETINYLQTPTSKYMRGGMLVRYKSFPPLKMWDVSKLKPGLFATFSAYPWSSISSNVFSYTPSNFRQHHVYNTYDSDGNPLTSTNAAGLPETYTWTSQSLMSSVTQNPGGSQHQTVFEHEPMVGLSKIIDPNSIKTTFEYDHSKRLRLIRDNKNNILSRFRYHYKAQNVLDIPNFTISGDPYAGNSVMFSTPFVTIGIGNNTYRWEFGDGNVESGSSTAASHVYSTPGTYEVYLHVTNPEGIPTSVKKQIIIQPELIVSMCANGPIKYGKCSNSVYIYGACTAPPNNTPTSTTKLIGTVSGGCAPPANTPPYIYKWEYQRVTSLCGSDGWVQFGSDASQVDAPSNFLARTWEATCGDVNYNIKLTVTDRCGRAVSVQTIQLSVFKDGQCNP
jgi:YD repeat-containing protein